mmetsp:Transcript_24414/g.43820  ORF Transcript_24414/g.43820 Transcript_24414/m.43820 type:complete len:133 (+) Transcript_24414:1719-2117(+)
MAAAAAAAAKNGGELGLKGTEKNGLISSRQSPSEVFATQHLESDGEDLLGATAALPYLLLARTLLVEPCRDQRTAAVDPKSGAMAVNHSAKRDDKGCDDTVNAINDNTINDDDDDDEDDANDEDDGDNDEEE